MVNISDNAVHLEYTISASDRESISLTANNIFFKCFISSFGHKFFFIKADQLHSLKKNLHFS